MLSGSEDKLSALMFGAYGVGSLLLYVFNKLRGRR